MRQHPTGEYDAGDGAGFAPRVYMGADGSAPAWRDEQLGQIFRNMRLTMQVSRETIARRLATSASCVDNFEAGAVTALPHGRETSRIVRGYCQLVQVDPEPILRRIGGHMEALASQSRSVAPMPPPPAPVPASAGRAAPRVQAAVNSERTKSRQAKARAPRRRRAGRVLFALGLPVALLAAVVYLAHVAPKPVYRTVALLPDPVATAARAGLDYLVHLAAPNREGLRWIEVGDPRSRKADKLPTSAR